MLTVRRADERGRPSSAGSTAATAFPSATITTRRTWASAPLRVINEDRVAPGGRLPDPRRTATWRSSPTCSRARSSTRTAPARGSVIRPGDVQRMSAGTGIRHSEFNASDTGPGPFPADLGHPGAAGPDARLRAEDFSEAERRNTLRLIGSRDGRDGSVTIHQDVDLYASLLAKGETVRHETKPERKVWLQVARGQVTVNGTDTEAGDGIAIEGVDQVDVTAASDTEFLLFDMGRYGD